MAKQDPELLETQERLAEAQAQIEVLQPQAADAEARLATLRGELSEVRGEIVSLKAELGETRAARDSAHAELDSLRSQMADARGELDDAALKYREARLAAAPHIPSDLVAAAGDLGEIDRQFEAAERVVEQLRDKLQEDKQAARVPLGTPPRRAPDVSGLSAAEKIKLGLQERDRR